MGDIIFEDFNVNFETRKQNVKSVRDMNLTIKSHKITGIVGESGCGKSVLSLSILGLLPDYAKTSGNIYYDNKDITALANRVREKYLGREFGYISQNPSESLSPIRKIRKQFYESLDLVEKNKAEIEKKSIEILKELGFEKPLEVLDKYPFQLSGGQQQRVLTGIAISSSPRWIFADEPTKGLDENIKKDSLELFKKLRSFGIDSTLVITHDIDFAKNLCDEVMVMYSGQIVEMGIDVLDNPKHPYTKGFIESMPSKGMKIMEGKTLSPTEDIRGCRFANRCGCKTKRCDLESPKLYNYENSQVRCFLYDKGE